MLKTSSEGGKMTNLKPLRSARLDELRQLVRHIHTSHSAQEPTINILECISERIGVLVREIEEEQEKS
jgi:division protein CdvB (Snf7/Vps24/ESCRT-III family)